MGRLNVAVIHALAMILKSLVQHLASIKSAVLCRASWNRAPRTALSVVKKLDKCKRDVWRNREGKASKRFISINIYVTLCDWFLLLLGVEKILSLARYTKKVYSSQNLVALDAYSCDISFRVLFLSQERY